MRWYDLPKATLRAFSLNIVGIFIVNVSHNNHKYDFTENITEIMNSSWINLI